MRYAGHDICPQPVRKEKLDSCRLIPLFSSSCGSVVTRGQTERLSYVSPILSFVRGVGSFVETLEHAVSTGGNVASKMLCIECGYWRAMNTKKGLSVSQLRRVTRVNDGRSFVLVLKNQRSRPHTMRTLKRLLHQNLPEETYRRRPSGLQKQDPLSRFHQLLFCL